uniref:Uncharacterized protein n=1 Tax=Arundo donax TaxID=35708 RepID=A0A0A9DSG6_ARUDO
MLTTSHSVTSHIRFQFSWMKSTVLEICFFSGLRYRDGIIVRARLDVVRFSFSGACALTIPRSSVSSCQISM